MALPVVGLDIRSVWAWTGRCHGLILAGCGSRGPTRRWVLFVRCALVRLRIRGATVLGLQVVE